MELSLDLIEDLNRKARSQK